MRRSLWWMAGPLREAAGGDGADGGGGAAGGAGGGESFDPVKFRAEILGELTKQVNGVATRLEKVLKTVQPPPASGGAGSSGADDGGGDEGADGKKTGDPKLARQIQKLQADLEDERKARRVTEERARESARVSTLRGELAKHVAPDKLEAAVRIFGGDVRVMEDGSIVGGPDEVPVGEFLAEAIKGYEYLMPPKQVGGAGAGPNGQRGQKTVTLDDIKLGMTAEQKKAAWAAIGAAL